jgi:hypothetical protein
MGMMDEVTARRKALTQLHSSIPEVADIAPAKPLALLRVRALLGTLIADITKDMSKPKAFIIRRLFTEVFEEADTLSSEAIEYGMTQAAMVLYWAATGSLPLDASVEAIAQIQNVIERMPANMRELYPPLPTRELTDTDRYQEIQVVPDTRTFTKSQVANN